MFSSKIQFDTKKLSYKLDFFVTSKKKLFKDLYKVTLQYLFYVLYYSTQFLTLNLL